MKDGKRVTAGETVISRIASGAYREEAALSANIAKATLYGWLYAGAKARAALVRGERVSPGDRRYVEFLNAVEEAEAQALLSDWTRLGQLAVGGLPQVTVREKVEVVTVDGKQVERVVERVTTSDRTLPNASVLMWRMERRWPAKFGRRPSVEEVPVEDPVEVEVEREDKRARIRKMADDLRAYQLGLADGEARARETNGKA